ncbi:uncharacterized protein NDAI_0G00980 [Naumovozyma dairenensis CBS 421]|uniref:Uncharacterized protein n=1 Tax=Naumovozyma dairenensis (strain ATCC 10597 / BCRC 20456 / CBS 421 / NBRC 0211 / NRRL Y-12639) TaxID=1071378 RepID=G0WDL3_NAUDC|nr:hypothetical protein NDAI_0G00980 [Naumovozyma dairenensis CBS 421]CCD25874.2 hypothetical protein NDAI_0G00980 [Naumovozyma dairenensis CBS 421]
MTHSGNIISADNTDNEFDDISSFSSIDSYQPEPFTGLKGNELPNAQPSTTATTTEQDHDDTVISSHSHDTKHGEEPSRTSTATLKKLDSNVNDIEKTMTTNIMNDKTETLDSLVKQGLNTRKKSVADINTPLNAGTAEFPEEYRIETETGLVKAKTIESLRRQESIASANSRRSQDQGSFKSARTNNTRKSRASSSLDPNKLNMAVEKNKKELEKYSKHKQQKGIKGFFNRLFD